MTVTLVTLSKSGERKDFELTRKSTVIGRKTDADLRIPLSEISRAHCELIVNGDGVMIRDLGSSNGTFVNGERVDDEIDLEAGDKIRVGSITFLLQIDGEPANITPAMFAPPVPPTPPAAASGAQAAGKTASADAATVAGSAAGDVEDIEDLDIDDLDDLDMDDLSDLDLSDELDELSEDDLIEDDEESK